MENNSQKSNHSEEFCEGLKKLKAQLREFHGTLLQLEHIEISHLPKNLFFNLLHVHNCVNVIWEKLNKSIKSLEE